MSEISILGVNGSTKKDGRVALLLGLVLGEAERRGAKIQTVNLGEHKISPPTGELKEGVTIEDTTDDMPKLQELVLAAHGIVFASPTHWFAPSARMKTFIDRLTSLEHGGFLLEGKVGGFVTFGPQGGALNNATLMVMIASAMGMIVPPYAAVFDEGRGDEWVERDCTLLAKNMLQQIEANRKLKLHWGYPEEK